MAYEQPPYAPNVENQTVAYGGATWKGNPGGGWVMESGGGVGGGGGIDLSQVPSVQGYVQQQFAGEDPYLQALTQRMEGREDPLALYSRLEEEAGVPTLRKAAGSLSQEINTLEDTLRMIEPDVSAKTRESMVTEAQRRGMVEAERKPIREKLADFTRDLGRLKDMLANSMAAVATKTELGLRGQEQALEPLKLQYTTMVDRNARLLSGFTADRQTQLDMLYDKLNRQRQLDDREWELANQLGAEERAYKQALQQAAASSGYSVTGQESIDDLLGIIGDKAAEEIAFNRAQATRGSASSKAKAASLMRLRDDVAAGATFKDVVQRYSGEISAAEIRDEYNAASRYGPAKESESVVQQWQLGPLETAKLMGAETLEGDDAVNFLKQMGFNDEEIKAMGY